MNQNMIRRNAQFSQAFYNLLIQFALGLQTSGNEAVNTDQGKVFRLGQMSPYIENDGLHVPPAGYYGHSQAAETHFSHIEIRCRVTALHQPGNIAAGLQFER